MSNEVPPDFLDCCSCDGSVPTVGDNGREWIHDSEGQVWCLGCAATVLTERREEMLDSCATVTAGAVLGFAQEKQAGAKLREQNRHLIGLLRACVQGLPPSDLRDEVRGTLERLGEQD